MVVFCELLLLSIDPRTIRTDRFDPRFSPLSKASDSRYVKRGETDYSRIVPRIGSFRGSDRLMSSFFKIVDVVVIDFKLKNPN